jgi:hypothetical protein
MIWPKAAGAQVAGGSEANGGGPAANSALSADTQVRPEVPYCTRRETDDRPSTDPDAKRLTLWLSVRHQTTVTIRTNGYAIGKGAGTLKLVVMRDAIPIAYSEEARGISTISAHTGASVQLFPGRQYKLTVKPVVTNKMLGQFVMDVGVGETCP